MHSASELVSVEDYLQGELRSEIKHEYLGGVVYAVAGAGETHNRIAMNLYIRLGSQLEAKPCEPFGSDMKLRLRNIGDTYFYYPDAMVVRDPSDSGYGWRERPTVLFEILSEETRRVDEREKRFSYLNIPSLQAYVRIEQTRAKVVIERRTGESWTSERLTGLTAILHIPQVEVTLALADLYKRVSF